MVNVTSEAFRKKMLQYNYQIFDSGLNIVGWRSSVARVNHFDDYIVVYWKDEFETWNTYIMEATTFPGSPYLRNPLNKKGTAILKEGQYLDAFKLGFHKGKYLALVQERPVTVYRDGNRDESFDLGRELETGIFGINIHKASGLDKLVGYSSAGCQVIRDKQAFNYFIDLCVKAAKTNGNKFTYTLIHA